jgi:hypothetical protein
MLMLLDDEKKFEIARKTLVFGDPITGGREVIFDSGSRKMSSSFHQNPYGTLFVEI